MGSSSGYGRGFCPQPSGEVMDSAAAVKKILAQGEDNTRRLLPLRCLAGGWWV